MAAHSLDCKNECCRPGIVLANKALQADGPEAGPPLNASTLAGSASSLCTHF